MNKRILGTQYEQRAADFLKEQGYFILQKNYRCRLGEIDIIARDRKYLVFVEVKYRRNDKKGYPGQAVTYQKQRTISKVAGEYLMRHSYNMEVLCRFDVVSILGEEITLIKNAFEYIG